MGLFMMGLLFIHICKKQVRLEVLSDHQTILCDWSWECILRYSPQNYSIRDNQQKHLFSIIMKLAKRPFAIDDWSKVGQKLNSHVVWLVIYQHFCMTNWSASRYNWYKQRSKFNFNIQRFIGLRRIPSTWPKEVIRISVRKSWDTV
jgi:hypothetical protein